MTARAGIRAGIAGARAIVRGQGAKVVLPPAAALATMAAGGWIAGLLAAPGWAPAALGAFAAVASLDLLLRRAAPFDLLLRREAPRVRPARARAENRRRRGGAPGRD